MFDGIIGQQHARSLLTQILERDRVPHAMLFEGPEGVGKATMAHETLKALLCTADGAEPCGACNSCKLTIPGGHPDVSIVRRLTKAEKKSKQWNPQTEAKAGAEMSKDISVDQIRDVTRAAGMSPRHGRRRAFLIDPADRMNSEAQNALLKTLEEPTEHTVLILIASRPRLLLPTVRSRSFAVRFQTLRTEELAALLEARGVEPAEARLRAALSEGRPGQAIEIELDDLRERRENLVEVLEKLVGQPLAAAAIQPTAAVLAGKDEATMLASLQLLQGLLRDAGRAALDPGDPTLIHADLGPRLAELGARLTPQRAARLVASADRLRGQMRFNLNRTLIAESLLAGIAGGPIP